MIEVIVSGSAQACPHCESQIKNVRSAFSEQKYRIIELGTEEFNQYDLRERVDAVPFVVIRDDSGKIKYAQKGRLEEGTIRRIQKSNLYKTFNLRETRATVLSA